MNTLKNVLDVYGKKVLLTMLMSIVLVLVVLSAGSVFGAEVTKQQQASRELAQNWIEQGTSQYQRGNYEQAERSLLSARDYEKDLTDKQREELNTLLAKVHQAVV